MIVLENIFHKMIEKTPAPLRALDRKRLARFQRQLLIWSLPLLRPRLSSGTLRLSRLLCPASSSPDLRLIWAPLGKSPHSGRGAPACGPINLSNEALVGIPDLQRGREIPRIDAE